MTSARRPVRSNSRWLIASSPRHLSAGLSTVTRSPVSTREAATGADRTAADRVKPIVLHAQRTCGWKSASRRDPARRGAGAARRAAASAARTCTTQSWRVRRSTAARADDPRPRGRRPYRGAGRGRDRASARASWSRCRRRGPAVPAGSAARGRPTTASTCASTARRCRSRTSRARSARLLVADAAQCAKADGLIAGEAAMAEPLSVCAARRAAGGRTAGCAGAGDGLRADRRSCASCAARRAGAAAIVATDLPHFALGLARRGAGA